MSDKTKKKKVRLNVIDILIILLVVALIATVVYRVYTGINDKTSPTRSRYVITFECDGEYDSIVKYLKDGKAVYFADSGVLLGHMYAPSNEKGAAYVIDTIKTETSGLSYNTVSIRGYIKMSGEAIKATAGEYYSIGDINISVGSRISVYTNEAEFKLTVKSIDAK